MATYTQAFAAPPAAQTGGLQFSNITVVETDTGNAVPFTQTGASMTGYGAGLMGGGYAGLNWGAFDMAIAGAGSSESLQFSYDVTDTNAGSMLGGLDALYVVDQFIGPGDHLQAVENAYDPFGHLIGTRTYVYGSGAPAAFQFSIAQQTAHIVITLTESIDSTGAATSGVDLSQISTGVSQIATSQLCSIGDIVFLDTDSDGLEAGFDNGPGVAGVTVNLLDATGATVLATTITDANGRYAFNNLFAGAYEVQFVALSGYTFTTQGVGTNSGINSSANQTTGITGPITLAAGQQNHNVEAGLVQLGGTAALGDYVWLDANQNGIQDTGEVGVANVGVELIGAGVDAVFGTSDDVVLKTTTTDTTGHYAFTGLAAGQYEVKFYAPSGEIFTVANAGTSRATDSNPGAAGVTGPITLAAGQVDNTIDAGLRVMSTFTASIGGLTPGFWAQHQVGWDGAADTKYNNLVKSGVLRAADVLYALPNHGASGPGGAVGVLLGDTNGNGVADSVENTLFVPLAAAQQLINSATTANDTRQILLKQALASQLNIDNGDRDPGLGGTVGTDLISLAVKWLKGQGPFIYSDGSSGRTDFVGASGVIDSGTTGTIDYNTKTASFTSTQLTSSTQAWNQRVDLALSPTDFMASGQDIKNALMAFNQNQLVSSSDGTMVAWNNGSAVVDIHANTAGGMWAVLKDAGIITG